MSGEKSSSRKRKSHATSEQDVVPSKKQRSTYVSMKFNLVTYFSKWKFSKYLSMLRFLDLQALLGFFDPIL